MELRSPIRIYWDITPLPDPLPDYDRICSEIAASRALTLHLTALGESLAVAADVVRLLCGAPLALSVTVSHAVINQALPLLKRGVKKLFIDVSSAEAIRSISGEGISGISFRVTRENHDALPDIIAVCMAEGFAELQLPMERLAAGESPLCLTSGERDCLAGRVIQAAFAGELQITANDPFLWRVVNPDVPFPDGICQAANTMLAIDPAGNVYPCPAMPVLLGNLQSATFREIVSSALKKEVRAKIVEQPSGCTGCPMLDDCRGGCRGRGLYSHGSWEKPDPGCGM